MIENGFTLSHSPAPLELVAAQRIRTRSGKMGRCHEGSSRQVLERKSHSSRLWKTHLPWKHSWKMKHPGFWLNRFLSISSLSRYLAKLKKKIKYMSLPFLKKMKSWQNLWHLSLKNWWSVKSKSSKKKKKGGMFSFGKKQSHSILCPWFLAVNVQQS